MLSMPAIASALLPICKINHPSRSKMLVFSCMLEGQLKEMVSWDFSFVIFRQSGKGHLTGWKVY